MIFCLVLLRLAMLALSFLGYTFWLSKYVKVEFTLSIAFSAIGSFLFVAGILNILQEAAWLIFLGGMFFFFNAVKEKRSVKELMVPGIIVFLGFAAGFIFLLYQSKFLHYDNFSHWGVAAKVVCQRDFFPNLANTNIEFSSYPLGSTCFIYYITEIIGIYPEWLQMWAQAILISGMAVSLFAFCRGKLQNCIVTVVIVLLLCSNINFVDLLVDTLLPLTGFAALAFCIFYREQIDNKLYFVVPYTVFLISIKNSGALFALYVLAYALFYISKNKSMLMRWMKSAICPVIVLYLWNKHVAQVFENGLRTKHSMNISNFQKIFSQKTGEEILFIFREFLNTVFSLSNTVVFIAIGFIIIWLLSYRKSKNNHPVKMLILYSAACYILYQVGMLGMYLFSMPNREAMQLAGYDRYHETILIFISALLVIVMLLFEAEEGKSIKKWVHVILPAIVLAVLWYTTTPQLQYYQKQSIAGSERERYDLLISEYQIESGGRYLVIVDENRDDSGYLRYMTQYLFAPQKLSMKTEEELKSDETDSYDYIIMFDQTETGIAFLKEQFGSDEPVVCLRDDD